MNTEELVELSSAVLTLVGVLACCRLALMHDAKTYRRASWYTVAFLWLLTSAYLVGGASGDAVAGDVVVLGYVSTMLTFTLLLLATPTQSIIREDSSSKEYSDIRS